MCRKKFGKDFLKIRFFHCGEYGERNDRPHHHVCFFDFDLPDREFLKMSSDGKSRLYTSKFLDKIWGKGYCIIGDVPFESAAYVARYICKKVTGELADGFYEGRLPEYVTMSLKPGIGFGWYEKFHGSDVYADDMVIVRGMKCKAPRYYDVKYELTSADRLFKLKEVRKLRTIKREDNHWRRLPAKEKVKEAQFKMLKRSV